MNLVRELKKIASELSECLYVKLVRVDTEEKLLEQAKAMGFESINDLSEETGYSISDFLESYFPAIGEDLVLVKDEDLPRDLDSDFINMFSYAGGRASWDRDEVLTSSDGAYAYIDSDIYEYFMT